MSDVEALIAEARNAQREHSPDEWIIEELADALEGLVSAPVHPLSKLPEPDLPFAVENRVVGGIVARFLYEEDAAAIVEEHFDLRIKTTDRNGRPLLVDAPVKGGGTLADLIAEAKSWRNEDPSADSTEQVSEEVTSLIARLADALEFVTDSYVLKSWSGLFEILDEAYPEDVFLTLPDNESRDSGPRIISLIRLLDRERTRAQVAESRLEAVTAPTESEREVLLGVIAEERASVGGGVPVPWSYWAEESRHEMEKAANAILSAGFRLPVVSAPTKDYGTLLEWARETAGPKSSGIHELADAVDDLLSRLPVVSAPTETTVEIGGQVMTESQYNAAQFPYKHVPEPVYEYGVRYGHSDYRSVILEPDEPSCHRFVNFPPLWTNDQHKINPRAVRRVRASEWEPVPVGVDDE